MTTTVNGLQDIKALAGADLGTSRWLEMTQDRIDAFADATGDDQWIHVDPQRAGTGPFGTTIAHGYLTLSLVVFLLKDLLVVQGVRMGVNYGLERVRLPSPVPVGARLRLAGAVASVEEVAGNGVQMTADLTVEIEGSTKPALVARALYRYYE